MIPDRDKNRATKRMLIDCAVKTQTSFKQLLDGKISVRLDS